MIEELKIIVDLLQGTTETAFYAFIALGIYKLLELSIIVFPTYFGVKYLISRMFVDGPTKSQSE